MVSSRFIITVIGVDKIGIVSGITGVMADFNVNIVDISQTIMEDMFTMIMLAEVKEANFNLASFQKTMSEKGDEFGVDVRVQHEDTFRFMHRI
ncbi:ACT domain-containing protein [Methanolobus sp. ZRKC3]|uniref:ACT domain-containing protein n=1 Tax=Methanolobus sp. ZRKC3 TaxID=3125786 RepID=UPI003246FDB8